MQITLPALLVVCPRFDVVPHLCFAALTLFHLGVMSGFIFVGREVEGKSKESCVTLISPPADVGATIYRDCSNSDL